MKYASLMELYTDFLTGSPNVVSATLVSDVLNKTYSHDSITRMLSQPILAQKVYWQSIKKSVRQIEKVEGVIGIDDTFSEKPHSDENELIAWYFDHTQGKTIKAMNILTFTYANPDFELPTYIVNELKKHVVCAIKENRTVTFDTEKQPKEQKWVQVSTLDIEPNRVYKVRLKKVPFDVLLVKKVYHNLDGSIGVQYLISTDTDLTAQKVCDIYKLRWSSEDLHKSLKQNTALEKMPVKVEKSQANHVFASMIAQVKLEMMKIATKKNHYQLKRNILVQALRTAHLEIQKLKNACTEKNIDLPNFLPA